MLGVGGSSEEPSKGRRGRKEEMKSGHATSSCADSRFYALGSREPLQASG